MKILHLIDAFDCDSSARQLRLLGPTFAQAGNFVKVCCLGPQTPALSALRQSGVAVHALEWTRWTDALALWNLRAVIAELAPDLIHVWRLPALRALALVAKPMLARAIVSTTLPKVNGLPWWDRWLLNHVRCVALAGDSDKEYCDRHEIRKASLRVVSSAVDPELGVSFDTRAVDSGNILYVGRIDRNDGARNAVWAFDILRHSFPRLRLQMVGDASGASEIRALAEGLQVDGHVDFIGIRDDLPSLMRGATAIWLPRLVNRGRHLALSAMAQGRIVIGSDVPCLREVIRDRKSGFLVSAGNVMDIARRTRLILQDTELREQLERAAREEVERNYRFDDMVAQWRDLYQSIAA